MAAEVVECLKESIFRLGLNRFLDPFLVSLPSPLFELFLKSIENENYEYLC